MNEAKLEAIKRIIGSTSNIVDRYKNLQVLKSVEEDFQEYNQVLNLIIESRYNWLNWLTITQRYWQNTVSKNPNKQKHSDTLEIRNKYVKCNNV